MTADVVSQKKQKMGGGAAMKFFHQLAVMVWILTASARV